MALSFQLKSCLTVPSPLPKELPEDPDWHFRAPRIQLLLPTSLARQRSQWGHAGSLLGWWPDSAWENTAWSWKLPRMTDPTSPSLTSVSPEIGLRWAGKRPQFCELNLKCVSRKEVQGSLGPLKGLLGEAPSNLTQKLTSLQ